MFWGPPITFVARLKSRDSAQWNQRKHCNHCKKNDHFHYCNNVIEAFQCSAILMK